jgi:flagellar hook protein FlgE
MLQSIYSGVSSLQSFQTGIDVLANNIANVNTVGFRGSRTEFSNLFEKTVSTSGNAITSMQSGMGVRVNATSLDLNKGAFSQSGNATDLAISGADGWFGLAGPNNENFFTRAGNFSFDAFRTNDTLTNLRLVNPDGFFVTGTLANNTNEGLLNPVLRTLDLAAVATQESLIFPSELTYPVQATTRADFFGNLSIQDLSHVVTSEIISPQNERNALRLSFTKSLVQPELGTSWDVTATAQTIDGTTIYDTQTGVVSFDEIGTMLNSSLGAVNNNGAPVLVSFGSGPTGLISNDRPFSAAGLPADGVVQGSLLDYSVDRGGEVIARFTNGQSSVVGKVAIYHFQNDQGLEAVSGNKFRASDNSGEPLFYAINNGEILSYTLENSNVSLNTALTDLIIMQRSFDAASKTITTSDEMLKNALQM